MVLLPLPPPPKPRVSEKRRRDLRSQRGGSGVEQSAECSPCSPVRAHLASILLAMASSGELLATSSKKKSKHSVRKSYVNTYIECLAD